MPKLTLKQQRFIKDYLLTGNASQAVVSAGYKINGMVTAGSIAYENLKKPQIVKAIDKALLKAELTPEWVTFKIRDEANGKDDSKASDRIKALESLAKITQTTGYTNQSGATNIDTINITLGNPSPEPQYIDSTVVD